MESKLWHTGRLMKMGLIILGLALLCAHSSRVVAQDAAKEKRDNIRRLLVVTKSAELGAQIIEHSLSQIKENLLRIPGEPLAPAVLERILQIASEEMHTQFSAEKMIDAVIPIYDKYLSAEEVKALLAFYESPLGQKVTTVMPQIMNEAYGEGIKLGEAATVRVLQKIEAEGLLSAPKEAKPKPQPTAPKKRGTQN
ncbi:MAG TPA: DUF2059 domain-containing protein [Pyrinomonadaceae bacterium]|nr:DUF2059 domain-containing protein [Pyrinomonadaceae bacterium]